MRDFIVYMQPTRIWGEVSQNVTVDQLRSIPGTGRLNELDLVKEGTIEFVRDYDGMRFFRFSCKYQSEKSRSSVGEAPIQDLQFELYQRKGGLVTAIQAPKKAARVAVAALSFLVFKDPFVVSPFQVGMSDFRKLSEIVKKHSGKLTRFSLRRIEGETGVLRKFEVSGDFEQVLKLNLNAILESAKQVSFMGYKIPSLENAGTFSFRITEWGGGQIYQPQDPQPHEISALMALFEEAFLQ
jgi:hypothetical protein